MPGPLAAALYPFAGQQGLQAMLAAHSRAAGMIHMQGKQPQKWCREICCMFGVHDDQCRTQLTRNTQETHTQHWCGLHRNGIQNGMLEAVTAIACMLCSL